MKHKSYNFRIYPTKEQEDLLSRHFGHNRFVYNHFLRMKVNFYQDNKLNDKKSLNYHDTALELTKLKKEENTMWLKEVNSQSLQQTLRHLDNSLTIFSINEHSSLISKRNSQLILSRFHNILQWKRGDCISPNSKLE
jgi:putative transposase